MNDDSRRSRREFLKSIGRILAIGALVSGAGVLAAGPGRRNDECSNDGICSRCRELAGCGLPQALSARQGMSRKQS